MILRPSLVSVLALSTVGCGSLRFGPRAIETTATREMVAAFASAAPTIDGKLDDACWRQVEPITAFLQHGTTRPAQHQTFGYVCYDDSYLYIGMKCMVPEGVKLKGAAREHDSNGIFGDEIVEIMLDPGRTKADYYQLVLSVAGATFDCSRKEGGRHEDDAWNGEWAGQAFSGDAYWSAELAVPYHNLGIASETGSTWGINLCRESPAAKELSTLGADGMFNHAWTFPALTGVQVDFRKYAFPIGPEKVMLDAAAREPEAVLSIPITNCSGTIRRVAIERHHAGPDGAPAVQSKVTILADRETLELPCERLALKPMMPDRHDVFYLPAPPGTRKIVVRDADAGTVLSTALIRAPAQIPVMRLEQTEPRMGVPHKRRTKVRVTVETLLDKAARRDGQLVVTLASHKTGATVGSETVSGPAAAQSIAFETGGLPWGHYTVRSAFRNAAGREVASATVSVMVLPTGRQRVKPLNNLVSELMNAKERGMLAETQMPFVNPREGWVYIRLDARTAHAGRVTAAVTGPTPLADVIMLDGSAGQRNETMRYLPAGMHTVTVETRGDCTIENVIVRAVPELIYSRFDANPHVVPFGPYAGEFQEKYIFDNVNVFVSSGKLDEQPCADRWRQRGGRWLLHCSVPQETKDGKPITADAALEYISATPGYTQKSAFGSIADEFGDSQVYCAAYADAVRRLRGTPQFAARRFYPYANNLYNGPEGRALTEAMVDTGARIAWKRYLKQQPNEAAARRFLEDQLIHPAQQYRKLCPRSLEHIVVCFGVFSAPNEFLNSNPEANYRTYLDMQFHIVATDPSFRGIYGLMSYLSSYADEETLRWVARLFRHYGIEGRTDRLTDEPYDLTHLRNGDFARSLESWRIQPADEQSMSVQDWPGLGWLEGRYPRTAEGDTVLVTERRAAKPNILTQTIQDLEPGKLYSFRMFSADAEDLSKKERHALTIDLDSVDLVPERCFTHVIANCYSHAHGPYDRKNKAWLNYHWRVFRAQQKTATLTVSDWASLDEPGGRIGQKLMFNYAVVQPYFAPEG